jgi:3'-phosphoadenosine 5'-phosphosulfate sulfotransferase (PAPS reductase)/FAD synthetase
MAQQLSLLPTLAAAAVISSELNKAKRDLPDLQSYDIILVNSSAGKDSQAMLDYIAGLAKAAGVSDRVVVVHADLGRMEWAGTGALARKQAESYGFRFEVVKRLQGDLLDHVLDRGKWPGHTTRFCTSDHKRGQIYRSMTALVRELSLDRPARILNCLGLRAEESPNRAKAPEFKRDKQASNKTKRHVDTWLPIQDWTVGQVWDRIKASGVEHHWAYDLGMPRLSCVFCIFAPKDALVLAGTHNRELLDLVVKIEEKIGHTFRVDLSLAEVKEAVEAGDSGAVEDIASWCC